MGITTCSHYLVPSFLLSIGWAKVLICFVYSIALALIVMGTGKMIRKHSNKFIELFITR